MKISDLIFTGFNRRVAAVHRDTGELVWKWKAPDFNGYVTILLDGDRLIASVSGYLYAFDALTGRELWSNEFAGFGYGVASLASVNGGTSADLPLIAAAQQATARTAAASAGGAATAAAASS